MLKDECLSLSRLSKTLGALVRLRKGCLCNNDAFKRKKNVSMDGTLAEKINL